MTVYVFVTMSFDINVLVRHHSQYFENAVRFKSNKMAMRSLGAQGTGIVQELCVVAVLKNEFNTSVVAQKKQFNSLNIHLYATTLSLLVPHADMQILTIMCACTFLKFTKCTNQPMNE